MEELGFEPAHPSNVETTKPEQRMRASCAGEDLRRRMKGTINRARVTYATPPNVRSRLNSARSAGICTVSVTGVAPAPAAREEGENVAVAPDGKPLTLRVTAEGNGAPEGFSKRLYVAVPPRCAVCEGELLVADTRVKSCTTSVRMVVAGRKLASPE